MLGDEQCAESVVRPVVPDERVSYLLDVLTARDTWLHRLELAHATGRDFDPNPHDREVVAQVVRDLDLSWRGSRSSSR